MDSKRLMGALPIMTSIGRSRSSRDSFRDVAPIQIGRVAKVYQDLNKVDVVLIETGYLPRVPVMTDYAGINHGRVRMPHLEDAVVVAFMGGREDCPIVIGSLWEQMNTVIHETEGADEQTWLDYIQTPSESHRGFRADNAFIGVAATHDWRTASRRYYRDWKNATHPYALFGDTFIDFFLKDSIRGSVFHDYEREATGIFGLKQTHLSAWKWEEPNDGILRVQGRKKLLLFAGSKGELPAPDPDVYEERPADGGDAVGDLHLGATGRTEISARDNLVLRTHRDLIQAASGKVSVSTAGWGVRVADMLVETKMKETDEPIHRTEKDHGDFDTERPPELDGERDEDPEQLSLPNDALKEAASPSMDGGIADVARQLRMIVHSAELGDILNTTMLGTFSAWARSVSLTALMQMKIEAEGQVQVEGTEASVHGRTRASMIAPKVQLGFGSSAMPNVFFPLPIPVPGYYGDKPEVVNSGPMSRPNDVTDEVPETEVPDSKDERSFLAMVMRQEPTALAVAGLFLQLVNVAFVPLYEAHRAKFNKLVADHAALQAAYNAHGHPTAPLPPTVPSTTVPTPDPIPMVAGVHTTLHTEAN